jgi:hypothetical protein
MVFLLKEGVTTRVCMVIASWIVSVSSENFLLNGCSLNFLHIAYKFVESKP